MKQSKQKRTLTLIRGISGSGKSTYVKKHYPNGTVFSADQYFFKADGSYEFDLKSLGAAHASCKGRCATAMKKGISLVVLDNTNSTLRELKSYLRFAETHKYEVEVIRIICDVEVAIKRNTKDTPEFVIRRMHARFQDYPNEKLIDNNPKD